MNNIQFNGPFKDLIELFIKYKQSQNYKYEAGTLLLKNMNDYFIENNVTKIEITENVATNFAKRKNSYESNNTIYKRQHIIKEFAIFLKSLGYSDIYVYNFDFIDSTVTDFEQYIFTDEEINKLFKYIANNNLAKELKIKDKNFNKNFRLMIKLFYCCGLRRSECFNLRFNDIDVNNGAIVIRESKGYHSRLLPFSDSLLLDLKEHINSINALDDDYIFKKSNGKQYDKHFTEKFQQILKKLNIVTKNGKIPRLHDLRFTYAVKALEKMQKEGQDVYCTLPILSAYMGHKNISSTEYYLKYTEGTRNIIRNKTQDFNSDIFLKDVNNDE